jgi:hypothetical protein
VRTQGEGSGARGDKCQLRFHPSLLTPDPSPLAPDLLSRAVLTRKTDLTSRPLIPAAFLAELACFAEIKLTFILRTFTIYPSLAKLMGTSGVAWWKILAAFRFFFLGRDWEVRLECTAWS